MKLINNNKLSLCLVVLGNASMNNYYFDCIIVSCILHTMFSNTTWPKFVTNTVAKVTSFCTFATKKNSC